VGYFEDARKKGDKVLLLSLNLDPKNGSCGVENGASAQNRFGF
jgi:hypothetical protein